MAVSTRPEEFFGEVAEWERAGEQLRGAVERAGYPCSIKPGEGAFYGPKIEFDFRDVLGRAWTLATLQIDVSMPVRFDLRYVGRDGEYHRPAMLHRAVLGSLERFIALYTEMTAGDFPLWLSPVQAVLLPIADRHHAVRARASWRSSSARGSGRRSTSAVRSSDSRSGRRRSERSR